MVVLWDLDRAQRTASLTPHPDGATGVAFLADGVTVATTSRDGSVRLWDVALGRALGGPLTAHADEVWRVVSDPNHDRFVTSSRDGTVRIWDVLDRDRACERAAGAFDAEQRRTYLGPGESAAGCG
jgi:WD40 repeat protein